jgi:hypothetical protein
LMSPPPASKVPLGVLFVHGIGQQSRGATLIQAANPICNLLLHCTRDWTEIDLTECRLRPRNGPARARLDFITYTKDQPTVRQSWLLAEAFWANSFPAASFGELLKWSIVVLPWALLSHFGAAVRIAWSRIRSATRIYRKLAAILQVATSGLLVVVAPLLSLLAQAAMLLAFVIALIPVRSLQSLARRLQQQLASSIGDSYVLLSHPVQAAAMVSRIQRDLRWLARRCEKVALVAHSQGAALSYIAIKDESPENLKQFITYGSGLRKVGEMEIAIEEGSRIVQNGWVSVISSLLAGLCVYALFYSPAEGWSHAFILTMAGAALLLMTLAGVVALATGSPIRGFIALGSSTFVVAILALALQIEPAMHSAMPRIYGGMVIFFTALPAWFARVPISESPYSQSGKWIRGGASVLIPLAVLALLALSKPSITFWEAVLSIAAPIMAIAFVLLTALRSMEIAGLGYTVKSLEQRGTTWTDWFASSDPVSQGPTHVLGERSSEVFNRGSMWSDHTSYWENVDEFVTGLMQSLLVCAGWSERVQFPDRLKVIARRRWRVGLLAVIRMLTLAGLAATFILRWPEFPAIGATVAAHMPPYIAERLAKWAGKFGDHAIALILMSAVLLIAYQIAFLLWQRWNRAETRRMLKQRPFVRDKECSFVIVVAAIAGVAAVMATPNWGSLSADWGAIVILLLVPPKIAAYLNLAPDAPAPDK